MLILYDGICVLCNRIVRFVLKRDKKGYFHFASLQSSFAQNILKRHNKNTSKVKTIYTVLQPGSPEESVLGESQAVVAILEKLDTPWPIVGRIVKILPLAFANLGYKIIAGSRYKIFGKYDSCPVAPPEWRDRFILN